MRHKKLGLGLALLVLLLSAVLGATVLREPIAYAASPFQSVIVANPADNPVPVKQQGTVTVSGAPVIGGGGALFDPADTEATTVATPVTASALMVRFVSGGGGVVIFRYQGNEVLRVPNEAGFNQADPGVVVHVPLTSPVRFDEMRCTLVDCVAFYAGAAQ